MTSRERLHNALAHHDGPIPIDFGSTGVTGMHVTCVAALRRHYGLPEDPVKVIEPYQMLGEIAPDLAAAIGVDTVGVPAAGTIFGFPLNDWKPWRTPWGQDVLVPGKFNVRGLVVGGPYEIQVTQSSFKVALIQGVNVSLSETATFTIPLESGELEEVIVTASAQVAGATLAIGPGRSFSIEEIESMPTIARQIRDVIRIDPRVSLGRADNGAGYGINCLGGSSRSNAFTIDGSLAIDGFGLNEGTGTSARFAFPIPYDTVQSASVEFAPLDVQYSQFTGCAINVVTRPGSNEFRGSAFYLFNDDSLTGDSIRGRKVITDPFEDTNWGFDLSGPIIKDKLFIGISGLHYEKDGYIHNSFLGGNSDDREHNYGKIHL